MQGHSGRWEFGNGLCFVCGVACILGWQNCSARDYLRHLMNILHTFAPERGGCVRGNFQRFSLGLVRISGVELRMGTFCDARLWVSVPFLVS